MNPEDIRLFARELMSHLLLDGPPSTVLADALQRTFASDGLRSQRVGTMCDLVRECARIHGKAMGEAIAAAKSSTSP